MPPQGITRCAAEKTLAPSNRHEHNSNLKKIPNKRTINVDALAADDFDDVQHGLTSERLHQWGTYTRIDHVFDLVPFWRRAVDAAERGEELRLEEFLDEMEAGGGWRTSNDVWDLLAGKKTLRSVSDDTQMGWGDQDKGWGIREDWGVTDVAVDKEWGTVEPPWGVSQHNSVDEWEDSGECAATDVGEFVDEVARQRAVSEERRRQMHTFFQVGVRAAHCFCSLRTCFSDANRTEDTGDTGDHQVPPDASLIPGRRGDDLIPG